MTATYDPATDIGFMRLTCTDTDTDDPILQDEEYSAFLARESGNVDLGSARALDSMASNEAMINKIITHNGLTIDGVSVSRELRKHAESLRKSAKENDVTGEFAIAGMVTTQFSLRDQLMNEAARHA
jgi:hypothetical protein